jgi:hypothetical protein
MQFLYNMLNMGTLYTPVNYVTIFKSYVTLYSIDTPTFVNQ